MNFLAISSEIATTILAMVILGIDLLMPKEKSRKCLGYITVIGLVGVFIAIFNRLFYSYFTPPRHCVSNDKIKEKSGESGGSTSIMEVEPPCIMKYLPVMR